MWGRLALEEPDGQVTGELMIGAQIVIDTEPATANQEAKSITSLMANPVADRSRA